MTNAEEVGALVHRQREKPTDLLNQSALRLSFQGL